MPRPPTARMGEVPIREQVERYLHRLRYSLPFPCSSDEMYFGCMPPEVERWKEKGMFDTHREVPPSRASNFLNTVHTHTQPTNTGILHVSVDCVAEYVSAMQGNRGFEAVFWFRPPPNVPIPSIR